MTPRRSVGTHAAPVAALLLYPAAACAQTLHGGDIIAKIESNRLLVGAVNPQGVTEFGQRVFLGTFGEFPNFTDDPGIDSASGAFPPGAQVGFDILKALRLWDGCRFEAMPEERLTIRKSVLSVTTPLSDITVPGFPYGEANLAGKFHHHAGYTLLAPARQGVYLYEIVLWTNVPGVAPSPTVWIVFNQDSPVPQHEVAARWVQNVLANPCRPDLERDGVLNIFDFLAFQNLYDLQSPVADFEPDCQFNIFDFLAFQNLYHAGCP